MVISYSWLLATMGRIPTFSRVKLQPSRVSFPIFPARVRRQGAENFGPDETAIPESKRKSRPLVLSI